MLFLDDERNPSDVTWLTSPEGIPTYQDSTAWTIVRNQTEFQDYIEANGVPSHISFDNDLGTGQGEGIFCAQWLVDQILDGNLLWRPGFSYAVHSKNNIAAARIRGLLDPFILFMNARTG